MASIGKRILKLRKDLNLSQKELADKVGITEASLSRYENNLREPKAEIIAKISEVLGCSTDYLLGRTDNKNKCIKSNLYENNAKSIYGEIEETFIDRLIEEDIITQDDPIPKHAFEKALKYGINAAIEILKLEKELKK